MRKKDSLSKKQQYSNKVISILEAMFEMEVGSLKS